GQRRRGQGLPALPRATVGPGAGGAAGGRYGAGGAGEAGRESLRHGGRVRMNEQKPSQEPSQEPSSAFISALTTEHYVLQSAISANTSEVGTRASLYLFSLSSSLVALGFASRSAELFVPFVAIVLPALFILGIFTAVRLVDSNLEGMLYLDCIARIRRYYRTLGPKAAEHFAAETGRWPENRSWPALRMGPFVGLITTTSSMVALLNSIVAGVGVAMLAGGLLQQRRPLVASLIGAGVALVSMAVFFVYQK